MQGTKKLSPLYHSEVKVESSNENEPDEHPPATGIKTPIMFDIKLSLALSSLYVCSSIIFLLAVRHCRNLERKGLFSYDSTAIVMCIEFTKIAASVLFKYMEDGEVMVYKVAFGRHKKESWVSSLPYAIPALLYALYNNLTYYNLHHFDPSTVQIYLQSRVLFTGALFTVVWGRSLSKRQWLALTILTAGLVVKYLSPSAIMGTDLRVLVVFLQALLSSLAGVYNEYAFKRDAQMSIHQQNFFIYFYGIIFNLILGLLLTPEDYLSGAVFQKPHPIVIFIVILGATNGLSASLILKFIDVFVKAFASAVEVLIMAVASAIVFEDHFNSQNYIAATLLMIAIYLYYTTGYCSEVLVKPG